MSNIIFALVSGIVLGIHYGGRFGALPTPILYPSTLLFLVCCFWFLRETHERGQARYFRVGLGADDVVAALYAILAIAAWLNGYLPKNFSGLKMIAIINPVVAVLAYLAWVWRLQSGRESERQKWEEKFKQKHQIKV